MKYFRVYLILLGVVFLSTAQANSMRNESQSANFHLSKGEKINTRGQGRYYLCQNQVNWGDALEHCKLQGINSELATIQNDADATALENFIKSRQADFTTDFWLGGWYQPVSDICKNAPENNKCWKWSHGNSFRTFTFTFSTFAVKPTLASRITIALDHTTKVVKLSTAYTTDARKCLCDNQPTP